MTLDVAFAETMRTVVREEIERALRSQGGGPSGDQPMSYAQAAKLIGYHVSTLTKWVKAGLLPSHGRGQGKRVYRADVLKALELSSKPVEQETPQSVAERLMAPRGAR